MEHLHSDDHRLVLRHEGEHGKPSRMPEDAEDHRRLPAEPGEHAAQHRHREDLGHLPDAHHRHDPLLRDVGGVLVTKEIAGEQEIAVVDHRIDERGHEENEQERLREVFRGLEPRQPSFARGRLLWRRVRQCEAVGRQQQGRDARDEEDIRFCGRCCRAGLSFQQEEQWPGGQNPADRAAHPHQTELLLGVLHVRERDRIGDRDRGNIEQRVDEHEAEEHGKRLGPVHPEDRQATDEVAGSHELLGGKRAVGELAGEEDAHDRGDREGAANPGDLWASETEPAIDDRGTHIAPDQGQPRAPDHEFKHHHQPETERRRSRIWSIHAAENSRSDGRQRPPLDPRTLPRDQGWPTASHPRSAPAAPQQPSHGVCRWPASGSA